MENASPHGIRGERRFLCRRTFAMTERVLLDSEGMRRAIFRMSHEIVEQNDGTDGLVIVGLRTRGVPIAQRIKDAIASFERADVPCGQLDPTLYRDDLFEGRVLELRETELPTDVT